MSLFYELSSSLAVKAAEFFRGRNPGRGAVSVRYGREKNQHIVFHFPSGKAVRPGRGNSVIVYFHGGFLSDGPDMPMAARRFNEMGYCVACCGFRAVPTRFPAMIDDAFSALAAVLSYMRETGMGNSVILAGSSYGAIGAALCALDADTRAASGAECRIKGLLSVGGPLDLGYSVRRASWVKMAVFSSLTGSDAKEILRYSPAEHIGETDIRVLCVHGKYDNVIPYAGAMRFIRKLNRYAADSGRPCRGEMLEIVDPDYQHVRLTKGLWHEPVSRSTILKRIEKWLEETDKTISN